LPFGWLNIGGYTSLDKVFFYPKGSYQPDVDSSLPINYISLVALDSNMLGVTKYEEVLAKVQEMQDSFGKNRLIEIKDGYSFAFELIHPEHNYTKKPQGVIDIYIKNPDFNSTIWLNLQLSVPASEFEKYKNLSEIAYNSLNIDWDLLQQQIDYFLNENNQIEDLDRLLENLAEEIYL
jgi:hypothetical protein